MGQFTAGVESSTRSASSGFVVVKGKHECLWAIRQPPHRRLWRLTSPRRICNSQSRECSRKWWRMVYGENENYVPIVVQWQAWLSEGCHHKTGRGSGRETSHLEVQAGTHPICKTPWQKNCANRLMKAFWNQSRWTVGLLHGFPIWWWCQRTKQNGTWNVVHLDHWRQVRQWHWQSDWPAIPGQWTKRSDERTTLANRLRTWYTAWMASTTFQNWTSRRLFTKSKLIQARKFIRPSLRRLVCFSTSVYTWTSLVRQKCSQKQSELCFSVWTGSWTWPTIF